MRNRLLLGAVAAAFGIASGASAACTVSADAGAAARPVDMAIQADASLLVSMTMLPKMMHIDYSSAAADKPSCDLGPFAVGAGSYELYGEDKAGRVRKAMPAKKGDPIAQIIPVADIVQMIESSKQGKAAPTNGYLLATITKSDLTGWRYYTGMPDQAMLKQDIADVLGGGATPIFRNGADGKTSIFVPKK